MNRYLKTALKWFFVAALGVALWIIFGCAPTTRGLFNEYQAAHLYQTTQTNKSIDMVMTIRVRGFGDRDEKRAAWCAAWPTFCRPGMPAAGMSVSSAVPEIWVDLRETARGEIVINDLIAGHELRHIMKLYDGRLQDPDQ